MLQSSSLALLPTIGSLFPTSIGATLYASASVPSLGPGGRRRVRNHVACQTEESVLPDLREMQTKLEQSRSMLAKVTHALGHMDSQMRREVRQEYEMRMRMQDKRSGEKVTYLTKRADLRVSNVRAAARTEQAAVLTTLNGSMQQQLAAVERQNELYARQAEEAMAKSRSAAAIQTLLHEENIALTAKLEVAKSGGTAKEPRNSEAGGVVAKLEAALAARERTIASLREQLGIAQGQLQAVAGGHVAMPAPAREALPGPM